MYYYVYVYRTWSFAIISGGKLSSGIIIGIVTFVCGLVRIRTSTESTKNEKYLLNDTLPVYPILPIFLSKKWNIHCLGRRAKINSNSQKILWSIDQHHATKEHKERVLTGSKGSWGREYCGRWCWCPLSCTPGSGRSSAWRWPPSAPSRSEAGPASQISARTGDSEPGRVQLYYYYYSPP